MTGARTTTLATLRGAIGRLEAGLSPRPRAALGHAQVDAALQGGLACGAIHEVFAEAGRQTAAATGFVAAVARRVMRRRPLLWVRQDFAALETGGLSMSGLAELGLDPRAVIVVRAADAAAALRVAGDALACDALGAMVMETWGEVRALDLVASRRLTLAAQQGGVTGLLLRLSAQPAASTAETRWLVRAAPSPPQPDWLPWGAPVFDVELVRNRHGLTGRWIMEWNSNECLFREPAAHPQPVAAAIADRPAETPVRPWRRAG